MVAMNVVYAATAYPFGKLSDTASHSTLLCVGLVALGAADLVLASSSQWLPVLVGVALWGVHLGATQGLLATMIAGLAPEDLRGTAFGVFNVVSGAALLIASVLAGLLWEAFGAPATFHVGAAFCLVALGVVALRPVAPAPP